MKKAGIKIKNKGDSTLYVHKCKNIVMYMEFNV